MLDTFSFYFTAYSKAVASNPMLAGFALYFTGALTYLARNLPRALWDWLSHALTTSMEMNNSGYSAEETHFNSFLIWFMQSRWSKWSRNIYSGVGHTNNTWGSFIGPGRGRHFFFLNGRLFWFYKRSVDSQGTNKQKEEITIHTLGRKQQPLIDLINLFEVKETDDTTAVYCYSKNSWDLVARIPKRGFETVCIDPEIKSQLIERLDRFDQNEAWYRSKGIPYKSTNLLYGPPGTGKSTITKAVASRYNRSLCLLDLSAMSNRMLQDALASMPSKAVLLLEDITEATNAVKGQDGGRRTGDRPKAETDENVTVTEDAPALPKIPSSIDEMLGTGLTLSGILNALDGIIPLNDVIVMMTTNHFEKLAGSLIRGGRVDHKYYIGYMTNDEIHEYVALMYPGQAYDPTIVFQRALGCDIFTAFMESPHDLKSFLKGVSYLQHAPSSAASEALS